MFHLPGCPCSLGKQDWIVAVLLTGHQPLPAAPHRYCARFSSFGQIRRGEARWHGTPPEAVRQLLSTGHLIAKNNLAARQEQITPRHRTGRPKIDLSQIPNVIELKK